MARKPKPWYRKQNKQWYVCIDGTQHRLGRYKKEAEKLFHQLMASSEKRPVSDDCVAVVLDDFIAWCYENRAERTADRYKDFCQSFVEESGRVPVSELTSSHVTSWLNGQDSWNSTTKRNAITALQRGFNWAVCNRGLEFNPIRGMEKPKAQRRTTMVTREEFEDLLSHIREGDPFRDLLIVSWDSGSRPQEIKPLLASQIDFERRRAVVKEEEGAKGGITRAIYFPTERSIAILKRLVKERPEGPVFRNTRGNPWTGYSVKCRFAKLEAKVGKRYRQYDLRHSFVTRKLLAGVDSHVVAALAGHTSTKMIDEVYSHVAHDHEYMLKMASQDVDGVEKQNGKKKPVSAKEGGWTKKGTTRKSTTRKRKKAG